MIILYTAGLCSATFIAGYIIGRIHRFTDKEMNEMEQDNNKLFK